MKAVFGRVPDYPKVALVNRQLSNSPVLRQISVRAVMERLLRDGASSRASLSRVTGLSKQTISEVMLVLAERGWVRESGKISGGVGRTAIRYEIDPRAGFALGLDLGASTLRGVLCDIAGTIVAERQIAAEGGAAHLTEQARSLKDDLLRAASASPDLVQVATVATPGVMSAQGRLDLAPSLPGLDDRDFAGEIRAALACPVMFENDINAAALGEYWEAGQSGYNHFAFVSIGTGVGLGLVLNGALLRGASHAAGEIAYLPLGADPFATPNVERGTLENTLGADGIIRRFRQAGGSPSATVRDIFDRFNAGDPAAVETIRESASLAAQTIAAVTAVIDPDRVVLGGNIGVRPELARLVNELMPRLQRRPTLVETSRLGPRATVLGAAAMSLGEMHNSLFSTPELPGRIGLPTLRQ